jgi:hypothetical protein
VIQILKSFLAPLPVIFETPALWRFLSFLRHLQTALVMTIPHACRPMRRCRCPYFVQFSPSRLFPEGVAYDVRPHWSYGRVPFPHLERHPISPIIPPFVIRICSSQLIF